MILGRQPRLDNEQRRVDIFVVKKSRITVAEGTEKQEYLLIDSEWLVGVM